MEGDIRPREKNFPRREWRRRRVFKGTFFSPREGEGNLFVSGSEGEDFKGTFFSPREGEGNFFVSSLQGETLGNSFLSFPRRLSSEVLSSPWGRRVRRPVGIC